MPTYEYRCTTCGKHFDVFQSMSSAALTHCPTDQCPNEKKGEGTVERLIGAGAGLIFNGSGFYLTDYKNSGSSASSASDSGSSSSD
jgi:putative FmdB family regulatory protein